MSAPTDDRMNIVGVGVDKDGVNDDVIDDAVDVDAVDIDVGVDVNVDVFKCL